MTGFSIKRIKAITVKESRHIIRDPQTLFIVVLMPVIMMFIFGYALTTDVKDIRIAFEDPTPSFESRAIIQSLDAIKMFSVAAVENTISDPELFFRSNRVKAIIRIPHGFSRKLQRNGKIPAIQVLIDGSDPNLGVIIRNASEAAIVKPLCSVLKIPQPDIIGIKQNVLYNPQQKSAFFFVPGLMVIILTMISALLTSIALTREKELGTLSQLMISPVRPFEVVVGKIVPYMFLAAIDGLLVLIIGRIAFSVKIAGSPLLLAGASVLYIFVSLSIGLLISALAPRQTHAMIAAIVATLMPSVILTGFVFPVSSMPFPLQIISKCLPATYFLHIVRGIILKGIGIDLLWRSMVVLAIQGILLIAVSIKKFRMTV